MNKFILILLLIIPFVISSFDNPIPVPDPEVFGKKIIELIKTGDTTLYKNTFKVNKEIFFSLADEVSKDPYCRVAKEEGFKEEVEKNSDGIVQHVSEFLSKNIKIIENWKEKEKISLSKLEYLRTYYKLEYGSSDGIVEIEDANILTKHDTSFYLFRFREIILIKNNWHGGRLTEIVKLTPDFYRSDISYSYHDLEGDMIDESEYAADTVAMPAEEMILDKRKQKKRNRLYKKLEKLEGY